MKKSYNITLKVTVDVKRGEDKRRIPWVSFKGWKHGVVSKKNRFIDTDPIVKKTSENMKYIGENIFDAAKEMFHEDEELESE
jgi:hypothetical protein